MECSRSDSCRSVRNSAASPMVSADTWAMLRPSTVTARTSGRSRAPPHVGQGTSRM